MIMEGKDMANNVRPAEMERITTYITPPNKWEYYGSSPWSAYTHRRDNCAGRIPVSLGLETGTPGGIIPETDLLMKVEADVHAKPAQP